MREFYKIMKEHQIKWRKKKLPHIKENGIFKGTEYEHILPKKNLLENFYHTIQKDLFDPNNGYIIKNNIQPHIYINNLLSSWAFCANLYWPFRNDEGFKLLTQYLSKYTGIQIDKIESMDLEYEEKSLKPQDLLGEDSGKRGSGQTSPDLAIKFITLDYKKGIFLKESKFTEHSFYSCSGYSKIKPGKPINPDKTRCYNTKLIIQSDFKECHLTTWNRKYWDLLKNDLDTEIYKSLKKCPMSSSCYQLFRQQALAKGLESIYDIAISCVVIDLRNENIINSICSVGLRPLPDGWKELFPYSKFQWLTHNNWFEFVKANNINGIWDDWINYVGERYFNSIL